MTSKQNLFINGYTRNISNMFKLIKSFQNINKFIVYKPKRRKFSSKFVKNIYFFGKFKLIGHLNV